MKKNRKNNKNIKIMNKQNILHEFLTSSRTFQFGTSLTVSFTLPKVFVFISTYILFFLHFTLYKIIL